MKLKIGMKVKTKFLSGASDIVRTLTSIREEKKYDSGFSASADNGGACKECNRPLSEPIFNIDSDWFTPV